MKNILFFSFIKSFLHPFFITLVLLPRATALSQQAQASPTTQEDSVEFNHEQPLVPKKSQPCLTKHSVSTSRQLAKASLWCGDSSRGWSLRVFGKNKTARESARRRNNGSKTRKKEHGSCSRGNRVGARREERTSSGNTSRRWQRRGARRSISVPLMQMKSLCRSGWTSFSWKLWQKTERRKPQNARKWSKRTLTPDGNNHGISCARLISQCSSLTNDAMLRQARHQLSYASRPRASQRMKPTLSVIGLESLWIVVTVLLELIQKESWLPRLHRHWLEWIGSNDTGEGPGTVLIVLGIFNDWGHRVYHLHGWRNFARTRGAAKSSRVTRLLEKQNTDDGIDRDSDYPQASNVKGKTGHSEWDGNQVASVTSWNYSVPPCTGGACDNQDDAAFATVVAEREWCSVDLCQHCIFGSVHEQCFDADFNPAYNEMDLCVQLVGFDTAASIPVWGWVHQVCPTMRRVALKHLRAHGYVSASLVNAVDWTTKRAVMSVKNLEQCGSC